MRAYILLKLSVLLLTACAGRPDLSEQITGRWEMEQVLRNGNDVTAEHDPDDDRFIVIIADGTFRSGGHFGENTGRWSIDTDTGELFIDSDAGENDDSYWFISFDDDVMTWTGARGFGREFMLKHRRSQ